MKAENDLVNFFKNEHAVLLSRFEKHFILAKSSYNWKSLYSICKSQFEENHHAKEEEFIFDAVKNNRKVAIKIPIAAADTNTSPIKIEITISLTKVISSPVIFSIT